jgi:hypothetical protein
MPGLAGESERYYADMNPQRRQPDPAARWISHAIVGLAVGYAFGKKAGPGAFWVTAIISALAHEAADAPVAQVLSDLGA